MIAIKAEINQSEARSVALFFIWSPLAVNAPSLLTTKKDVASRVPIVAKASR
jgi:hypothetical protein